MKVDYDRDDLIRIVGLPVAADPFEGSLARVVRRMPDNSIFGGRTNDPAYEVMVINTDGLEATLPQLEEWSDLGMGIVYASEMEPVNN